MVSKEIDPSDIGKFPKLIQAAQKDMAQSDVLVCGICHAVFHLIELFSNHKQEGCTRDTQLRDSRETKPKVWAFLLWKAAQLSNIIPNNQIGGEKGKETTMNSWKLYQTWIKLDEPVRETWTVAGRTIQSFARMGIGTLQEMPVKITKTVVDQAPISPAPAANRIGQPNRMPLNKITPKNEEDDKSSSKILTPGGNEPRKVLRPVIGIQTQAKITANAPLTKIVSGISRKGKRTIPGTTDQFHEATVEKIVAKRFNPRRNHHEYLVKWDSFTHDQNTWEPQTHLDTCPQLLDTFEKQLARQKEQRAAQERAKVLAAAKTEEKKVTGTSPAVTGQIIIKSDNRIKSPDIGVKRKLDESSDTGNNTTEDDFEEDAIPIHSVKRLKNGTAITTKTEIKSPPLSKTINGTTTTKLNTVVDSSADVVITKDPIGTGIVRKMNASSPTTNSVKPEAHVRVLTKGENTASGIVRIGSNASSPVAAGLSPSTITITQKLNTSGSTPIGVTRQTQQLPTRAVLPTFKNQQQNVQQQQQMQQQQQQRMSVGNKTQFRSVQRNVSPQVRLQPQLPHQQPKPNSNLIQRPVAAQMANATNNKMITRKSPLQPATVQHQQKIVQPPQQRQMVNQTPMPKTRMVTRGVSPQKSNTTNIINVGNNGSNASGGIQLCPVTGKILSETGEEIPQPTPLEIQEQEAAVQLAEGLTIDGQQLITNEDGSPLLVTGEDGTIYQVAGKNAEGQTILIAQGEDGQQHFAYVAAAEGEHHDATGGGVLTLENVVSEAVSQQLVSGEQHQIAIDGTNASIDPSQALTIQTDGTNQGGDQDANIPAEVVQADLPSPGGTRRVILMLQDGTFMMTEMHDDEYQALNIS